MALTPSKNVPRLPSVALAIVLPSFWYDPVVPIVVPVRWPKTLLPLAALTLLGALAVLGAGGWIAYAGGKVRHIEFRRGVPPPEPE